MPREKPFTEAVENAFNGVVTLLDGMLNDRGVPRNIKRVGVKAIKELKNETNTPGVIASNVMYMVGDLSTDPNIPFHARTTIYRIISMLEKIKD